MNAPLKFAFADTETTGVEPSSRIIEAAVIVTDGEGVVLDMFETLVNPEMPIPPCATSANNITDAMVANAPSTQEAMAALWARIPSDAVLVAHYASFDVGMLNFAAESIDMDVDQGRPVIDTCAMAKFNGATKNNRLDTLVDHYRIKRQGEPHRAMCDARAMMEYYWKVQRADTVGMFVKPWSEAGANYHYVPPLELPPHFTSVPSLVRTGGAYGFAYADESGKRSERAVTPHGWYEKNDYLYLTGWCHLRNAQRCFRADRIERVLEGATA